MEFKHVTVLLDETINVLSINENGVYIDCTLGGGGHTQAILNNLGENGLVYAFDQDIRAIDNARQKFIDEKRVSLIHNNFESLLQEMKNQNIDEVDGIVYDLGVSSPQLDEGVRGFSYQHDAVLDMRMDKRNKLTAKEVVNKFSVRELSDIIWQYGDERWAKRIAQFIVEARNEGEIDTTDQLVKIIKAAIPKGARQDGPHPAKRTFQALRIFVNDELGALEKSLEQAVSLLKKNGRLAVITFHSLEDKIVKKFIKDKEGKCTCPPGLPQCACGSKKVLKNITRKPIIPSEKELNQNPRARSAKLRCAEKLNSSKL